MKIALLGYGKEGKSVENYFKRHYEDAEFDIFENFTYDEIKQRDYSSYDIIFRSPSVPPLHLPNESSITRYFFDHCPCPIIGVTATKGKGTICSFIKSLLDAAGEDAHLVGNIGLPALDVLDNLNEKSVVVYEMSSFQLWDLEKSPHVAVIGQIEPDHLNAHKDYQDYLDAKSHIAKYQTPDDYLIYFKNNPETVKMAENSQAQKVAYPLEVDPEIQHSIRLPGKHNLENATAAIAAVASYKKISPNEYLREKKNEIMAGLGDFKGLPHRLEFVRELNGIKYFDDNFSTTVSSTKVAANAFRGDDIIIIVGGRDKTGYEDLPELFDYLHRSANIIRIILMGESGHELDKKYNDPRFMLAESLEEAVKMAQNEAEVLKAVSYSDRGIIILMSPAAASFDMFENVYDRGAQFQKLVKNLK